MDLKTILVMIGKDNLETLLYNIGIVIEELGNHYDNSDLIYLAVEIFNIRNKIKQ